MAYKTVNPFTNKEVKSFTSLTEQEVAAKIDQADACYKEWRKTDFATRRAVMKKAATIMRENKAKFAGLVTLEMGKLISDAEGEVDLTADIFDYYADNAEEFLAPETLKPKDGRKAYVEHDSIGIILCVEPWNFPYYQLVRVAATNLMAGNVVMVKHASIVPQCAEAFEQLLLDAGAPKGAYTNLFVDSKHIAGIIQDRRIRGVAVTGSEKAGASVASEAGKALKKSTMELGGSDAFIVLEDADLDKACEWGLWGRMNNTGQCCVAAKRFIVVESVADKLLKQMTECFSKLKVGDPMDRSTTLGPLSSEAAAQEIAELTETAIKHGAKAVVGGKRPDMPGAFMEATILTNITKENPVFYKEFFGPVAMFFTVPDEKAAIELANDSEFGLGGTVFSKDVERAKKVASQIDTGMVFINRPTWTSPDLPFGGVKHSGYGRELSKEGILEFVNRKLIYIEN
ncbi:NAD-dependent succinate-semialdehyde dehydrogenase [Commensalibacter communis]|uniref:NAD-dependent succinate-semialdehyde dehydrogenase n=1 Tax=Commensalibacter communis TaxID=2972786 RepID=UPI0022FF8018|nr:NAD-dependent succinate-semialdehyde dehydrogenase [Commensalibacter communis]CAI3959806.1 Acyl-CoA reductase or other NAD-dependent aldehyde dehydrogenase (AdhE) (PDB:1A4S) [Commensalibacter communis]CAI3959990.1 Acyl-CoA reductase or other NAD-dependent aldehyde dehydrogenase (AdhE) (PDB:1A4S) [Commensalibacter communis]